ncbi:MAG: branched-chain amino acid aminotransferase, partial [Polyangiaceae bacterium]|nr:branched-chain amino acid aminotransferase [Polyangiaceae bacterium]
MSNTMIRVEGVSDRARAAQALAAPLIFGKAFADLMAVAKHTRDLGWHDVAIVPFGPLSLSPAAKVLHYGLEVFEGHKVYRWEDGDVAMFRPDRNAQRLNDSARRMRMPEVPVDLQLAAEDALVDLVRHWVPAGVGCSLYLRPMLIATEGALGVLPASEHLYAVFASPAGPYFPRGFEPISVVAELEQPRAVQGGIGAAKTGGNYGAGIDAKARARDAGFDEVLFLDAHEHRYLEELSGMNVFVVEAGERLVTPPLGGTILAGITRASILELASDLGLQASEHPLDVYEVARAIDAGLITEMLAVGTAAVVTPVGKLTLHGSCHTLGNGTPGPLGRRIYDAITGIQYGRTPDPR